MAPTLTGNQANLSVLPMLWRCVTHIFGDGLANVCLYRLACQEFPAGPNLFRAKDLKASMTVARDPLLTAIPISDIGIWSAISQAITEATLCLTADRGKMVIPMCASTSEISVGISPAVWETLGTILASRSIPKIKSGNAAA